MSHSSAQLLEKTSIYLRNEGSFTHSQQTDAIFANVAAVQQEVNNDPAALEISIDTKAKVSEGDYGRGKNQEGLGG